MLYWTYPTVVDIQKSSPSYLEIPAITICNPVGYNYTALCTEFRVGVCMIEELVRFNLVTLCKQHPESCLDGNIAPDYIVSHFLCIKSLLVRKMLKIIPSSLFSNLTL
ncbi:uncharacterized protein CEXT_45871 [Caerostris extrusa]|uniref:FZ domain-containing protein n=1 Tax=Caerostris extrusa TaxID=172846 RepID=A0AAV4XFB4_CAEEX|nr:uncharacterized protein CEXT_45871 [Caerostris extrusa]